MRTSNVWSEAERSWKFRRQPHDALPCVHHQPELPGNQLDAASLSPFLEVTWTAPRATVIVTTWQHCATTHHRTCRGAGDEESKERVAGGQKCTIRLVAQLFKAFASAKMKDALSRWFLCGRHESVANMPWRNMVEFALFDEIPKPTRSCYPFLKEDIHKLEMVQMKDVRFIHNSYNSST